MPKVYGTIGMINFAHGDVFMIGACLGLIGLTLLAGLGITSVPLALALALALALVAASAIASLYSWTVERVA
jgi:branched-chain amino acid transport system permease protein